MTSLIPVAESRLSYKEVIRQSSIALASNSNNVKALYQRALAYLNTNQAAKAFVDLAAIMLIYRESPTSIDNAVPKLTVIERISYIYLSTKQYKDAAISILFGLKESLTSHSIQKSYTKDSVKFLLLSAKLCLRTDNRTGALKNIQTIFTIDPSNKDAQWMLYILQNSPQPVQSSNSSSSSSSSSRSACDNPDQPMQS